MALYDLPSGNAIYIFIAKGKTVLAKPERNFIELYQLLITRAMPCVTLVSLFELLGRITVVYSQKQARSIMRTIIVLLLSTFDGFKII